MAIPACLWRRTGEIYKANREFAELVGVEGYMLREVGSCHSISPSLAEAHPRVGYASTSSWPKILQ